MRSRLLVLSVAVLLCSLPRSAAAAVIPIDLGGGVIISAVEGASLVVEADSGIPVIATYLGSGALFESELSLDSPSNSLGVIFDTATNVLGDTEDLGTFPAGTELIFEIEVFDHLADETFNFFSGPAFRNFDGVPHAAVADADTLPPALLAAFFLATGVDLTGQIIVGFEDVPEEHTFYDADYNDVVFAFTNVRIAAPAAVPEPTALLLLGTGAAGLLVRARRRTK